MIKTVLLHADSNFAATGDSMGIGKATDNSHPRVPTGPVNSDAKQVAQTLPVSTISSWPCALNTI